MLGIALLAALEQLYNSDVSSAGIAKVIGTHPLESPIPKKM